MLCIHTVEYYLVIKRKEVLFHATASMDLDNIMLSDRRQPQKIT